MFKLFFSILITNLIMGSLLFSDSDIDVPQLSVRGEARIRRPADQLTLNLGVLTEDKTAEKALSENNTAMQSVMDALKNAGLSPSEYQTATFNIRPILTPRPQNPPPEWYPTVIGFRVTNNLTVRTEKLNLAGSLIDAAIKAGANTVDSVSFSLKDYPTHRADAITQATSQAIADAETLAEAANIQLDKVLNISLDDAVIRPKSYMAFRTMDVSASIEPGDVDVTATVTIDYQIRSH
ncbi:MAG: 26 kDa periplasmic immunogenic protein [Chlamydiae bacterium]|nr:26 kDa periplasmic immunogenic protein [Chlamydiota bacterium]